MLVKEHRCIENAPILALFDAYYKTTFPVIVSCKTFLTETHENTH